MHINIPHQINTLPLSEVIFPTTFEYRLHKVKTSEKNGKAIATIYDGTRKVFQTHGPNLGNAITKAKQWIDEQDEMPSAHDLHTARMEVHK